MENVPQALRLILCTCPTSELAEQIAHKLVENRYAACINILPGMRSIYRWHGKIESDAEVMLFIKTDARSLENVEQCIRQLHRYDIPEMIALPILEGHAPYLNWLIESVTPP